MAQHRLFRRITRSAGIGTIAASALFVAAPVAAVIAAPGTAFAATPSLDLGNTAVAVKTSNGQSWDMILGWIQVGSGAAPELSVGITRLVTAGGSGYEEHVWRFDVTAPTLTFNSGTGAGTLDTGSQTSPVATIDLAFKSTSNKKATCTSGSETIYSGTLKGELKLVTGLTGGGTVGGTALTFNIGTPEVTVDSACVPPAANDCANLVEFNSTENPGTASDGIGIDGTLEGNAIDFAGVAREITLSSPKGAVRDDTAALTKASMSYDATTKVFSVSTSTAGIVTGSATLKGGKITSVKTTCTLSGKKYDLTLTGSTDATYASPSGKSLTAHTSLTGNLTAPASSKTGAYEVSSIKLA